MKAISKLRRRLKKTRRIEITAFRRTIISGDGPDGERSNGLPQSQADRLRSIEGHPAQFEQSDLVEAILSTSHDASSSEWTHMIEALVASKGDGSPAAQTLEVGRSRFYSKLRSLGLSVKNLRTNLNRIGSKKA